MITAIDTNIVVGVLEGEEAVANHLARLVDRLAEKGDVLISPIVYAELLAAPSRSPALVDAFLSQTAVRVDWSLEKAIWQMAGLAYRTYVLGRHMEGASVTSRRILADFLIGAHAVGRQATLLTWDERIYHTYFPDLSTVAP
ncbi:MAG TPA: PIN domain-containing protein [Chloroflexota bacterium]|nr:PIN domain-containing protein [Chloroflexota bacterium]